MTEIAEQTMSYEGLVDAGRAAREQADNMQWIEGDLALQVEALSGNERPRDPETGEFLADEAKALKRYAEDVDLKYSSIQEYRRIAQAWSPSTRVDGVAWRTHAVLASQEDRLDLIQSGMTSRQAEKIVRQRTAGNSSGKPSWLELLGHVGDSLIAAEKAMTKTEAAIADDDPGERFSEKAGQYAEWAESLATRLRAAA